MMKTIVISLFIAGLIVACNGVSTSPANATVEATAASSVAKVNDAVVNVVDSLKIDPQLGDLKTRAYQGVVPAASCPGIDYTLVIYSQENSGDGVYKLSQRYIEAEDGKDVVFTTYGRRYTLRGDAENKNAVVYQLVPFDSKECVNLLLLSDDNLELLNNKFERPKSKLNYTLRLQNL